MTRLNGHLDDFSKRIVVFIDDLDRLENDGMLLILRLVRLSASFRKTTCVLAFDRNQVENVLDRTQGSGKEYLEKIVQVGFDIPLPSQSKLQQMLLTELEKVIADIPEAEWESDRWTEVYTDGLRHIIKTPRDIVRYVNGLQLDLQLMSGETNPVDFAGLEAIRTFAPQTYEFIRENQDLVLGPPIAGVRPTEDAASVRQVLDDGFALAGEELAGSIRALAQVLFPQLSRIYRNAT